MGNATTASVTGVQVATGEVSHQRSPHRQRVWAFAVGQFGWALLSGIISNWLVYFYQPDQETISQGQTCIRAAGPGRSRHRDRGGRHHRLRPILRRVRGPGRGVSLRPLRRQIRPPYAVPWKFAALLPLAVVTVLVFWSPINGTSWVNAAFLFVTVIGYYIALTFYCTPYNALIAELGHDSSSNSPSPPPSPSPGGRHGIAYMAPVIWARSLPMMGRITAIRVTFTIMAAVAFGVHAGDAAGHPREGLRQLPSHLRIDHRIPEADVRRRRIPQSS